ncbi:PIAS3 ligase, partial [Nothoprocta pentlandii]|nr:PIAS3 ligase [Nothoprocta pentlandii]
TVLSFRVPELQALLGFAGRNKSGRKHELLSKALQLLKAGGGPALHGKIEELYGRRIPRKILTPADFPALRGRAGPAPLPVRPDVKMKRLPFYDVYDELLKPTALGEAAPELLRAAWEMFSCSQREVWLPSSRAPSLTRSFSLLFCRFCLCETSCPQKDYFPPNLFVKVNGKLCPLPGYLPPTKNGAEPKRPSCPVNITPLVRLSATVLNTIVVNWSPELGRSYSLSVYLVKQLTAAALLQKLRAKGIRNPDHSRALIKEKLTADPDSEIATTSLRVSLMCPLGKVRLMVPCRAITCTHLQCFDAALYLQMNEKKPKWTCPVCDKKAPYNKLIIDGLFMEILNSCTDCDEIQFTEDGSWCPMKPKKENQEVCQTSAFSGIEASALYSASCEGKSSSEGSSKVEVIDLTLDSSSDEEELLAQQRCPMASAALP